MLVQEITHLRYLEGVFVQEINDLRGIEGVFPREETYRILAKGLF